MTSSLRSKSVQPTPKHAVSFNLNSDIAASPSTSNYTSNHHYSSFSNLSTTASSALKKFRTVTNRSNNLHEEGSIFVNNNGGNDRDRDHNRDRDRQNKTNINGINFDKNNINQNNNKLTAKNLTINNNITNKYIYQNFP